MNELATNIVKNILDFLPPWAVIPMNTTANHLRKFAIEADKQVAGLGTANVQTSSFQETAPALSKNPKLEEAARLFAQMFSAYLRDRGSDLEASRKWGIYYTANLLFKTYVKLRNVHLSGNIVQAIKAQTELPPFEVYPAAHRVTYKYYLGLMSFLQEDYESADQHFTESWNGCLHNARKNQELILTYLIPCRLITANTVPTRTLLESYPRLDKIFGPLIQCIKRGDLAGFDEALAAGEAEFVRRRVYLTLERGRDIAQRNLLRKVFLAAGYVDLKEGQTEADRIRRTRIPLAHFAAALRMGTSGQYMDDEEVECVLSNMIYKGLMKGYIAQDAGYVVLNKKGAFPGTGV